MPSKVKQLQSLLKRLANGESIEEITLGNCLKSVSVKERYKSLQDVRGDGLRMSQTALHGAAGRGYKQSVSALLDGLTPEQHYEILKIQDSWGNTALHWAAANGHTDTARALLDNLTQEHRLTLLKVQDSWGDTALHWAANKGHTDTARALLRNLTQEHRLTLLKIQTSWGRTALHRAAYEGHTDTARVLLSNLTQEHRLTLLKVQDRGGRTALHRAASRGHTDTARVLLSMLIPAHRLTLLDMQDKDGRTARDEAIQWDHPESGACLQKIRAEAEEAINKVSRDRNNQLQSGVTREELDGVLRAVDARVNEVEQVLGARVKELEVVCEQRDGRVEELEAAVVEVEQRLGTEVEKLKVVNEQQTVHIGNQDGKIEDRDAKVQQLEAAVVEVEQRLGTEVEKLKVVSEQRSVHIGEQNGKIRELGANVQELKAGIGDLEHTNGELKTQLDNLQTQHDNLVYVNKKTGSSFHLLKVSVERIWKAQENLSITINAAVDKFTAPGVVDRFTVPAVEALSMRLRALVTNQSLLENANSDLIGRVARLEEGKGLTRGIEGKGLTRGIEVSREQQKDLHMKPPIHSARLNLLKVHNAFEGTAWHRAADQGDLSAVEYLLDLSPQNQRSDLMSSQDSLGRTALHWAAVRGHTDLVRFMCKTSYAPPDKLIPIKDESGRTALHYAKYKDIAELLIESVTCVEGLLTSRDVSGKTALHYSAELQTAFTLFQNAKVELTYIQIQDNDGNTAVMYLCKVGQVDTAVGILDHVKHGYREFDFLSLVQIKNHLHQNIFHLIGMSGPLGGSLIEHDHVFDSVHLTVKVIDLLMCDVFGNTPLSYLAAKFSTKLFAELIMKILLAERQMISLLKNKRGVSCQSIVNRRSFSSDCWLYDILCVENGAFRSAGPEKQAGPLEDVCLDEWKWSLTYPEQEVQFDERIWKVMKYALNQYSIMSPLSFSTGKSALTSEKRQITSVVEGGAAEDICPPVTLFVDLDDAQISDSDNTLQMRVNTLDVAMHHGKPKIVLLVSSDARRIPKLTPPGPDFCLVSVLQHKRENQSRRVESLIAACPDLESLLFVLRMDPGVESVDINSTLGSRYLQTERPDQVSPAHQIVVCGKKRGRALVICNKYRRDWEQELRNVKEVLQGRLGLDVEVQFDPPSDKMIEDIAEFSSSPGHGSMVVLVILSHGEHRNIWCADDKLCSVQKVVDAFCVKQLMNVPKVVFLSFCRGKIKKRNRTHASWEFTELLELYDSPGERVRNGLTESEKRAEWSRHPFPGVEVPENCYLCYATLPDSLSQKGLMFEVFSEHLAEIYAAVERFGGDGSSQGVTRRSDIPTKDHVDMNIVTGCDTPPDVRPQTHQPANLKTDKLTLPRVELVQLLTDLSFLVREESAFSQYMNVCYKLTNHTKDVVIEVLPACEQQRH